MKIVYLHHAERDLNHIDINDFSKDTITERGKKEARLIGKLLSRGEYTCIYTSPYNRCVETAEIINEYLNVPIYEMEELNEWQKGETKNKFIKRNIRGLKGIVGTHKKDDNIICITSGVNLTAFICFFYNVKVTNHLTLTQGATMSPVNFFTKEGECD